MKKSTRIILVFFFLASVPLQAQWSLTGNNNISAATNFVGTINNASLVFKTNNTERMRINTLGNVGIGTKNPSRNLHITSSSESCIRMEGFGVTAQRAWDIKREAGEYANLYFIETFTGGLIFDPSDLPDTCLTLTRDRRVGIGTSAPAQNLHIKATDNADIRLEGAGTHWNIAGGSKMFFAYYDPVAKKYNDHLTILTSGNIGIGTTNPQSRLAVNGTVTAKQVDVTLSGWADFVFQPGYKLRSIEEVEQFIKANCHLPDVPSEKDMLSKNHNLGQTDALLMQKIEELTLYIIELKKELNELKQSK